MENYKIIEFKGGFNVQNTQTSEMVLLEPANIETAELLLNSLKASTKAIDAINAIIEYMADEQADYENAEKHEKDNHIYKSILQLEELKNELVQPAIIEVHNGIMTMTKGATLNPLEIRDYDLPQADNEHTDSIRKDESGREYVSIDY